MKKWYSILLAASMVLGSAAAVSAATGDIDIAKTTTAPKLDGKIDDIWKDAKALKLDQKQTKLADIKDEKDLSGTAKALWDDKNIYVLVEIKDDKKVKASDNAYQDDSVELYTDGKNTKADKYGDYVYQFRVRWSDPVLGGKGTPGNVADIYKAVQSDTSDGYIVEYEIPLDKLGITAKEGTKFGFAVHVNDNDTVKDGRKAKLSTNTDLDDKSASNPSLFATATLGKPLTAAVAAAAAAPASPAASKAPTASTAPVAASAAPAAASTAPAAASASPAVSKAPAATASPAAKETAAAPMSGTESSSNTVIWISVAAIVVIAGAAYMWFRKKKMNG